MSVRSSFDLSQAFLCHDCFRFSEVRRACGKDRSESQFIRYAYMGRRHVGTGVLVGIKTEIFRESACVHMCT